MTDVMQGVRVLEVAEHTFVPAASALLADWGAEVIKIEHVERGDAMRGLASTGVVAVMGNDVHALLEHSNRGKKSLGLDLTSPDGLDILYQLAATSRRVPHQQAPPRAHEAARSTSTTSARTTRTSSTCAAPARASADPTPTRARTTRSRSGPAPASPSAPPGPSTTTSSTPPGARLRRLDRRHDDRRRDHGRAVPPRAHRRGHRRRRVAARRRHVGDGAGDRAVAADRHPVDRAAGRRRCGATRWSATTRPATAGCVSLCCLQAGQYWPPLCEAIGRPELATDAALRRPRRRCSSTRPRRQAILARGRSPSARVDEWRERAGRLRRAVDGRAGHARGRRRPAVGRQRLHPGRATPPAGTPFRLVAAPVQFDEQPRRPRRAPEFNEHGDEILAELGLDWDAIIDLKVRGVVA